MLLGHVRNLDVSVLVGDMYMCLLLFGLYYIVASLQVHNMMCARSSEKKNRTEKNPNISFYSSITHNLCTDMNML